MRPRRLLALVVAATALVGSALIGTASAATNWTVIVGGGNQAAALLSYQPMSLRVNAGDTVTWSWSVGAPHTVSFLDGADAPGFAAPVPGEAGALMLNPKILFPTQGNTYDGSGFANSGFVHRAPRDDEKTWALTFTKPGTYRYQCLLHPFMQGEIVVEPAGVGLPSAAEVAARGAREAAALMANFQSLIAGNPVAATTRADGGRSWTVWAGTGPGMLSVDRFLPEHFTVDVGDTVVWRWGHPAEPHTVTFPAGQKPPEVIEPRIQAGQPPMLLLNPRAAGPSQAPSATPVSYDGTGYLNSGLLPMGPGPQSTFAVTFTRPGQYPYVCLLHPGMEGVVNVRAAGTWPPVLVDSTSWRDGDTVGYAFAVRNAGSTDVRGLTVQASVPQGTHVVESWLAIEDQNRGVNTGSEVQWFEPGTTLKPGDARGPYVVIVKLPEGMAAHQADSAAMVSFSEPSGNAVSARIAGAPAPAGP